MKAYYLAILLLSSCPIFSQTLTIEGSVKDKVTGSPLEFVNVYLKETNFGTVTNQSGNFRLTLPNGHRYLAIKFSHIGYQTMEISLLEAKSSIVISLEPQSVELNEIVVTPPDPVQIVYDAILRIPENYDFSPHTVKGFQRETVTLQQKIIQLLEVDFKTEAMGDKGQIVSTVRDARYIEDKREKAPFWNPSRGGFYTFGWTTISAIENPTSRFLGIEVKEKKDLIKFYDLELQEPVFLDGAELVVVRFGQKQNIKRALLSGRLYIEPQSGAIVKLEYEISKNGLRYLKPHETWGNIQISKPPKRIEVRNEKHQITYRKYGTKWYLNAMTIDATFEASLVFFGLVQSGQSLLAFHSERLVTDIDTLSASSTSPSANIDNVGSIPTLQNFIKKTFEKYELSDDEQWSSVNIIAGDTSFSTIAAQLIKNNTSWELERHREQKLSSEQLNVDLAFLKESLQKIHPGIYWYSDKKTIDEQFEYVRQQINKGATRKEFFLLLSSLIEKIHCGHTELMPLNSSQPSESSANLFPLKTSVKGDTMIVMESYNAIEKGSQILKINNQRIEAIVKDLKSRIPADGYSNMYKEFQISQRFPKLFARYFDHSETFDLTLKDSNGNIRQLSISLDAKNSNVDLGPGASFIIIDSLETGLLTIQTFSGSQDFPMFLEKVFTKVHQQNLKDLIIDIRNNEGGRDEYGKLLFSYLTNDPFLYYKRLVIATIDTALLARLNFGGTPFNAALPNYRTSINEQNDSYTYVDHPNLGLHQPQKNPFLGKVYVLVNGGTFSTAAEFASIVRGNNRALFIGEETGGGYYGNCSLGSPTLLLPNSNIGVLIPLAKYELAVPNNSLFGRGLIPEIQTRYNIKDILTKNDKDMNVCIKLIQDSLR